MEISHGFAPNGKLPCRVRAYLVGCAVMNIPVKNLKHGVFQNFQRKRNRFSVSPLQRQNIRKYILRFGQQKSSVFHFLLHMPSLRLLKFRTWDFYRDSSEPAFFCLISVPSELVPKYFWLSFYPLHNLKFPQAHNHNGH